MSCANSDLNEILRGILDRLTAIEDLLQPVRCTAADVEALNRLLPAVGGLFGSSPSRTRELLVDPAIRALYSGSLQSLGMLFSRAADDGAEAGGLRLERVCKEHGAMLWRVVRCLPEVMDSRLDNVVRLEAGGRNL